MINIQDDIHRLHSAGLLERLLADKTTGNNIVWATDEYTSLGERFSRDAEIHAANITGVNRSVVKSRVMKEFDTRFKRTRRHAEVFTPTWVCRLMNDYADEIWFGRRGAFDFYFSPPARVDFGDDHSWKKYVDSRRLEITCGEAPFLAGRYDVTTGEIVPLEKRIGILDRKLRVVNENALDEDEWFEWALRAFQATYGYEYQGDNLLIARVNLAVSFAEYLYARWKRAPVEEEWQRVVDVVAWNLWQMDGLTLTTPCRRSQEKLRQRTFFDDDVGTDKFESAPEEESRPFCRIRDWRRNRSIFFKSMRDNR